MIVDSSAYLDVIIENPFFNTRYPEEGGVMALIDTGYEGFMAVPVDIFKKLGLHELYTYRLKIVLPTGDVIESEAAYATVHVVAAKTSVDGLIETFKNLREILIGQELLSNFRLVLDFCRGSASVDTCRQSTV